MSLHHHQSRLTRYARWFYHESGLESLHATGPDAWYVVSARACRMFAFGGASLIMALFFAALGFTDTQIGLFMTMTLVGDVVLSLVITLMADGLGRRRVLFAGGLLMALSGGVFVYFENFWVLLLAAIVGIVSATGGDFGPFRSIEESVLSHLTNPKTRSDVLSWYVTTSSLGAAAGIEVAGRVVEALRTRDHWSETHTYHAIFCIYIAMGVVNMALAFSMSAKCEIQQPVHQPEVVPDEGEQAAQGLLEDSDAEDEDEQDASGHIQPARTHVQSPPPPQNWKSRFSQISKGTRSVMYKLWILLAVDSLADGMTTYTLTNYYLDLKFHLSKSKLGDFMSANHLLGSVSTVLAGPLARHLGLINTMVFTHIPSSVAVLLFPLPKGIAMTIVLLFIRGGLNNMDQAPRAAFIAGAVRPDERTAVMGVTSMLRTLAATIGPTITGALAENDAFWVAFVAAGALRIAYDLGLWAMFVNMKLHVHEEGGEEALGDARRLSDEESLEMQPVGLGGEQNGVVQDTMVHTESLTGRVSPVERVYKGKDDVMLET